MATPRRVSLGREMSDEEISKLRLVLGKRIYKYNTVNPSDVFGLKLKEGLQFEGSLKFFYSEGEEECMKVVTMTSHTMVNDLLPLLIQRFCFQNYTSPDQISFNSSENYILMRTGGGDRRLLGDEHPLQLALDVVEHTSENPLFCFCSNITQNRTAAPMDDFLRKSNKFLSSSDAPYFAETSRKYASNGSLQTLSESESPSQAVRHGINSGPKRKLTKMSFLRRSPMVGKRARPKTPDNTSKASPASSDIQTNAKDKSRRPKTSVATLFNFSRSKSKYRGESLAEGDSGASGPDRSQHSQLRSLLSPTADLRSMPKSVLLHIYGPVTTVASGQVYKTVLVPQSAPASEVIRQALERYNIRDDKQHYVLMDTVGREEASPPGQDGEKNDAVFVRLCTRQLHKEEVPVLLDRLWKPANSLIRRFELIKRSEVSSMFKVTPQVERSSSSPVLRARSIPAEDKFSDSSSTDLDLMVSKSEDEISSKSGAEDFILRRRAFTSNESLSVSIPSRVRAERVRVALSRDSSPLVRRGRSASLKSGLYQAPQGSPYLLNLTPSRRTSDHILFQLGQGVTELGIFASESSVASDGETTLIHLNVLQETFPKVKDFTVCRIYTPAANSDEDTNVAVLEIPQELGLSDCIACSLNGHSLFPGETFELHHSDLVQISHSMCMFVDPADSLPLPSAASWAPQALKDLVQVDLQSLLSKNSSPFSTLPRDDSGTLSLTELHDSLVWNSVEELEAKHSFHGLLVADESNTSLSEHNQTSSQQEDEPLHTAASTTSLSPVVVRSGHWCVNLTVLDDSSLLTLVASVNPKSLSNKLALSYILAMGLQYHKTHSSVAVSQDYMGIVLESLQVAAMKSCKQLSEWKPHQDVMLSMLPAVYPLLGGSVFWLSNVAVLTGFVNEDVEYNHTAAKQRDAMVHLAQYILQMLSDPVTRVLYQMLHILLSAVVGSIGGLAPPSQPVNQIIDFLQLILYAFEDNSVPQPVVSQFFASLFCFINGSLINLLLEGGEGDVLCCSCGRWLKQDLDLFRGWCMGVGFEQEASRYLSPLLSLLSLLSTPEEELLQLDWTQFRELCPSLHPAQLRFILDNYSFDSCCDRPVYWCTSNEDLQLSSSTEHLRERFQDLPQMDFSTTHVLSLSREPPGIDELGRLLSTLPLKEAAKKTSADAVNVTAEKRDSPCPDSGLDSPARLGGEAVKCLVVPRITVDLTPQDAGVSLAEAEAPTPTPTDAPDPMRSIVVGSMDVVEEQPPPLHVMTMTTSPSQSTTTPPSQSTTTPPSQTTLHENANVKNFVLSRGSRDFGVSLALSSYSQCNFKSRIVIAAITPISLSEENDDLMQLTNGDVILKIDGTDFGSNLRSAEQYLKDAEDEITLTIQKKDSCEVK